MKVTKTDTGVRLDLTHAEARIMRHVDTLLQETDTTNATEDEMPQIYAAHDLLADIDDALSLVPIRYYSLLTSAYDEDPA